LRGRASGGAVTLQSGKPSNPDGIGADQYRSSHCVPIGALAPESRKDDKTMKRPLIAALLLAGTVLNAAAKSPVPAETGPLACTARVLEIQDTDIGLNHGALARLTLRVTPPRGRTFETTAWKEVSMDVPPRRGSTLRVTCDPANPSDIHPID
jgi:hypothetical protein